MVTTLSVIGLIINANLCAMAAVCCHKNNFVIKLVVLCKYLFKHAMLLMLLYVAGCLMFDYGVFMCTTVKAFVSFFPVVGL